MNGRICSGCSAYREASTWGPGISRRVLMDGWAHDRLITTYAWDGPELSEHPQLTSKGWDTHTHTDWLYTCMSHAMAIPPLQQTQVLRLNYSSLQLEMPNTASPPGKQSKGISIAEVDLVCLYYGDLNSGVDPGFHQGWIQDFIKGGQGPL